MIIIINIINNIYSHHKQIVYNNDKLHESIERCCILCSICIAGKCTVCFVYVSRALYVCLASCYHSKILVAAGSPFEVFEFLHRVKGVEIQWVIHSEYLPFTFAEFCFVSYYYHTRALSTQEAETNREW